MRSSFPGGSVLKNPPADAGLCGFDPWVREILWRRKWQPSPVFSPGEYHGEYHVAWQPTMHGIARVRHDLVTKQQQKQCIVCEFC